MYYEIYICEFFKFSFVVNFFLFGLLMYFCFWNIFFRFFFCMFENIVCFSIFFWGFFCMLFRKVNVLGIGSKGEFEIKSILKI